MSENKYLQIVETVGRRLINDKRHKLKRVHPHLDTEIVKFIKSYIQSLYPLVFDEEYCNNSAEIEFLRRSSALSDTFLYLTNILFYLGMCREDSAKLSEEFLSKMPETFEILEKDALAYYEKDPACKNVDEVILCYPGFKAVMIYRAAHELYNMKIDLLPRLLTEYAHRDTGIDIHPGAKIGESFFIDHGTGVVIGETAEIGSNVVLYQNVTLGAKRVEHIKSNQPEKPIKRHPTICDNCVVYAGATILGGDTIVGKNCIVGANVWLTHSVEENSVIKKNNA